MQNLIDLSPGVKLGIDARYASLTLDNSAALNNDKEDNSMAKLL
ncbi:MAG: hypothetical protein R2837_02340 [Aliarcobacter sp.]